MSEEEKLIVEIATRFRLATIEKSGFSSDLYYARQCVKQAKEIVKLAKAKGDV